MAPLIPELFDELRLSIFLCFQVPNPTSFCSLFDSLISRSTARRTASAREISCFSHRRASAPIAHPVCHDVLIDVIMHRHHAIVKRGVGATFCVAPRPRVSNCLVGATCGLPHGYLMVRAAMPGTWAVARRGRAAAHSVSGPARHRIGDAYARFLHCDTWAYPGVCPCGTQHSFPRRRPPLAEAKAKLSRLTKQAKAGTRVVITSHGTPLPIWYSTERRHADTPLKRPGPCPC